jgi:hypothetical protein
MSDASSRERQRHAAQPSYRRRRASFHTVARTPGNDPIATDRRVASTLVLRSDNGRIAAEPMLSTLINPLWSAAHASNPAGLRLLLRQLRERLAFARTSTRLYEELLAALETSPAAHRFGLSRDVIVRFRNEEAAHFELLCEAIESLGSDPLAVVASVSSNSARPEIARQATGNPRKSIANTLQRLLDMEQVDQSAWELLVATARASGYEELARRFGHAWFEETEHVRQLQMWVEWFPASGRRVA